jgi:hypothetical protein
VMFTKSPQIGWTSSNSTSVHYRRKSEASGWWQVSAMLGLTGGLLSNLLGLILTSVAWFMSTQGIGPTLHRAGTVLLMMNIPLLIAGAHFMDLVEKRKRVAVLTN